MSTSIFPPLAATTTGWKNGTASGSSPGASEASSSGNTQPPARFKKSSCVFRHGKTGTGFDMDWLHPELMLYMPAADIRHYATQHKSFKDFSGLYFFSSFSHSRGCVMLKIMLPPGRPKKILLSNGRGISGSHYYERDGKIITVRPFGEVAYSKEEVSEIRDQSANAIEPGAAPDPVAATPRVESGAAGRKYPATMWFQADLRRLPRNTAAAKTRIDELIAQEKARIVELEGQLPGLGQKAETKVRETERKIEQALADYGQYAEDQSKHGIRGKDVIAASAQASGISTVAGPMKGIVIIEDSTKFQINAAEKDIERCQ